MKRFSNLTMLIYLCIATNSSFAETTTIAVASNFSRPMKHISNKFDTLSQHKVVVVFASSGKLYAQIRHGAPFDVFLSADSDKPIKLESSKVAVSNSRFTYAYGSIVLWSAQSNLIDNSPSILSQGSYNHIAIANPKHAPYGIAAQQTLQALNLYSDIRPQLIFGENIAQTYQFIASGNAEIGFIASSQLSSASHQSKRGKTNSYWRVPAKYHKPIKQDAILLNRGKNNTAALAFIQFLKSNEVKEIIKRYGYR